MGVALEVSVKRTSNNDNNTDITGLKVGEPMVFTCMKNSFANVSVKQAMAANVLILWRNFTQNFKPRERNPILEFLEGILCSMFVKISCHLSCHFDGIALQFKKSGC